MGEREQKLETLQSKVSELKTCSQGQETPAKLQVLNMIRIIVCVFFLNDYILQMIQQLHTID